MSYYRYEFLSKEEIGDCIAALRKKLEEYCRDHNLQSLVLGISGGIDSALMATIVEPVAKKLNIPFIGRSIVIDSNKEEEIERAKMVGEAFCTDFKEVNLTEQYKVFLSSLEQEGRTPIADGNVKARMRMMYLYDIAGRSKGMVLGTDMMTEFLLGFFTIHGDHCDYNLIASLWKTDVFVCTEYLANHYGILRDLSMTKRSRALKACLDAMPTDGLGVSNSSLDQIMPNWGLEFKSPRDAYKEVDLILMALENGSMASEQANTHPVVERWKKAAFKREWPVSVLPLYFKKEEKNADN